MGSTPEGVELREAFGHRIDDVFAEAELLKALLSGNREAFTSVDDPIALNRQLARLENLLGIEPQEPRIYITPDDGKPVILASVRHCSEVQDCRDAESTLRRRVHERLTNPRAGSPDAYGVDAFSKDEVGVVIRNAIFEQLHAHREMATPIRYATEWIGNAEPRKGSAPAAHGNKLVMALLEGFNSYWGTSVRELSYLRELIVDDHVYELNLSGLPDPGETVYRSRFFRPTAMMWGERGDTSVLGEKLGLAYVPELDPCTVAYVDEDAFRNIKLNVRSDHPFVLQLREGTELLIEINGVGRRMPFQASVGSVGEGKLVAAIGTTKADPVDPEILLFEIYKNNDHAAHDFKGPEGQRIRSGMKVEITDMTTGAKLSNAK